MVDLGTGQTLIDVKPRYPFFIASVRKVFTVGELMNQIGPAHTFNTPVYRQGDVKPLGILTGNLIVVASGDLTMGGRTKKDGTIALSDFDHNEANALGNAILTKPNPLAGYAELARQIAASGIRQVRGDVVIDDRLFKPYFFREEFNLRPIFVNDDAIDCVFQPAAEEGQPVKFRYRPHTPALTVTSQVKMSAAGTDINIESDGKIFEPFIPNCTGGGCTGEITGQLPIGFKPPLTKEYPLIRVFRIVQPSDYPRTVLIKKLRAVGVTVTAPTTEPNPVQLLPAKNSYKRRMRVAELQGLPYSEDARFVMKVSYNIGSDTSLLLYGVSQGVDDMDSTLKIEAENLQNNYGINPAEYHFIDGSGGGETTAFTRAVTRFLTEMATRPAFPQYFASFPILGVDGSLATVTDFESDKSLAPAKGQVFAKTGTFVGNTEQGPQLRGQAFAGYINAKSGRKLVYQLVVNNVPFTDIADVIKVFQDEGMISAILWRDN